MGNNQLEIKKLDLSLKKNLMRNNYCKSLKINWFASAWDIKSLEFLDDYNLSYQKIASAMIVDSEFLKQVAKRNKHTFISTGMSTKENIDNAVSIFRKIIVVLN